MEHSELSAWLRRLADDPDEVRIIAERMSELHDTFDGPSNDEEHDAAVALLDALTPPNDFEPDPEVVVKRATDVALSVNTVKSAHFTFRNDTLTGVVYDGFVGIEFDVRLSGDVWYVNDDQGRTYEHTVLERAILRAIEANRKEGD